MPPVGLVTFRRAGRTLVWLNTRTEFFGRKSVMCSNVVWVIWSVFLLYTKRRADSLGEAGDVAMSSSGYL